MLPKLQNPTIMSYGSVGQKHSLLGEAMVSCWILKVVYFSEYSFDQQVAR